MIENIKKILYNIMLTMIIFFVGYVVYRAIFDIYGTRENLKPIVLILGTVTMIMAFIALKKIIKKFSKKQIEIFAIVITVLFFIGLSIFGNVLTSIPSYDLSNIISEANAMIENGGKFVTEWYFAKYANQTPLAIMIYGIYRLGVLLNIAKDNLNNFAVVVNSLFMAISAYFTYLSVRKVSNEKNGLLALIFFVINPIFYLYSSYFYSDIISMPFGCIAIYLYICSQKSETVNKKIILLIFAGLILSIGYKIRVVIGILLIAMIFTEILQKQQIKLKLKKIISLILGFIVGILLFKLISMPFNVIENKNIEFPPTQWMTYAFNEKTLGKFNGEDHGHIIQFKSYDEKVAENLRMISSRLKEMGLSGLLSLSKEKLAVTWSNGEYDYRGKYDNVENVNKLYEYCVGNKALFVIYYLQICKVTVMFLFLIAVIHEFRHKKENQYNFLLLAILGGFLFYEVWEVLTRYSLTFLPWIIMFFAIGISDIEKFINIKNIKLVLNDNTTTTLNLNIVIRVSLLLIVGITVLLEVANFSKYAVKKDKYYDQIVTQASGSNNREYKIAQNIITQTFCVNKKFNSIAIRFYNQNTTNVTHYHMDLINQKDETIVQKDFDSSSVKDNYFKTFVFDYIKPDGSEQYTIKIYSDDATEENTIGIAGYELSNYDVYTDGTLSINEQEENSDIRFRVQKMNKRSYISKKMYIIAMIVIVMLEIYSFYPYIKREKRILLKGDNNGQEAEKL